jgi:hypothetical protein
MPHDSTPLSDALSRLDGMGLPLLPIGYGEDKKGPVDSRTGGGLKGWPTCSPYTVPQLRRLNGHVVGVGVRTGMEAGLLVFDFDSPAAWDLALSFGCDPQDAITWQVHRDTSTDHLKVIWRYDGDIEHTGKLDGLEVFFSQGRQIIIAGAHHPSSGHYLWPDDRGPEALAPIPDAWLALAIEIWSKVAPEDSDEACKTPGTDWRNSGPSFPCPICGRNTSGACSIHNDGQSVQCMQGETFSPPLGLAPGATIVRDGVRWAFAKTKTVASFGLKSVFTVDKPLPKTARTDPPPRTFSLLLADTLAAIRIGDIDAEMDCRAEIKGRFRVTDAIIDTRLFNLLTEQESGSTRQSEFGCVSIEDVDQVEWLIDGFVHENDQAMLAGEAGVGKTVAMLAMAFAVIDGTGFLDHSTPARKGKVLAMLSDGGLSTAVGEMANAGLNEHPAVLDGPDRRFFIWAHSDKANRKAWDVSIAGVLSLLAFVRQHGIDLVLIDSCKSVMSKAGLNYTDNQQVSALLTFFKEVVCRHCAVVWINHDGSNGAPAAGAKSWKEIPSSFHRLDKVSEGKPPVEVQGVREWTVKKIRLGSTRRFRYSIGENGQLALAPYFDVTGSCGDLVTSILMDAWRQGVKSLPAAEIYARVQERRPLDKGTIKNTLSREATTASGRLRRVAPAAHYALRSHVPLTTPQEGEKDGSVSSGYTSSRVGHVVCTMTSLPLKPVIPMDLVGNTAVTGVTDCDRDSQEDAPIESESHCDPTCDRPVTAQTPAAAVDPPVSSHSATTPYPPKVQTNRQLIEHALTELALAPSPFAIQRVLDFLSHHGHRIPKDKVQRHLLDLAAEDHDDDPQLGLGAQL